MRKLVTAAVAAAIAISAIAGPVAARNGNWTCENRNGNQVGAASCTNGASPNDWYNPGGQNPPGANR